MAVTLDTTLSLSFSWLLPRSGSWLLQDVEEVAAFELAVLGHVGAVQRIPHL